MIEAFTSQLELWNEKAKKKRLCREKHKDCKCYRGKCSQRIFWHHFDVHQYLVHISVMLVGKLFYITVWIPMNSTKCCLCCICTEKSGIWYREVIKISRTEATALDKEVNKAHIKQNDSPGRLTKISKIFKKPWKELHKVTPKLQSNIDFYTFTGSGHRKQDDLVDKHEAKV